MRLLLPGVLLLSAAVPAQICGDCDGDQVLSIIDALRAAQIGAALITPTPADLAVCDVDSDTDIDVLDALRMAQAAAQLPVPLTCAGAAPSCSVVSPAGGAWAGDIDLEMDLADPDSPTVDVSVEFSTSGGVTWALATPAPSSLPPFDSNPALAVAPGPGQHFVWSSSTDLGAGVFPGVELRITVDDGSNQATCSTVIDVDPTVSCSICFPLGGIVTGTVPVMVELQGPQNRVIDATFEVSRDGGLTWDLACLAPAVARPPLVSNPAQGVAPGGPYPFAWSTLCNFGPLTVLADFRVTVFGASSCQVSLAADNPPGAPAVPPARDEMLINEVLAAPPPGPAGDANEDGVTDLLEDEFLELVNVVGRPLDLSNVIVEINSVVRHVFPPGTELPAGRALILFGGGTPSGAFALAEAQTASTGSLQLQDSGDTILIYQQLGTVVDNFTYGNQANQGQSIVNDPEPSTQGVPPGRPMVPHTTVNPALLFSVGTHADGCTTLW